MGAGYLWHVTLNTGDARRSPRGEVADGAIAATWSRLEACLAGDETAILPAPYRLTATAGGGAFLLGTLSTAEGHPLVTFGVAPRARGAGRLWSDLHRGRTDLLTLVHEPPQAPWCAARIEAGVTVAPIPTWSADMERTIAWAWIERRNQRAGNDNDR